MRNRQADDCPDDLFEEQQRQALVGLIWSYTLALEQYVVNLRRRINTMAELQSLRPPYPDLESDFRIRYFRDYPAYDDFNDVLEVEETDLVLPD